MKKFKMCPDCQREYDDPSNRRFHAQPNACPQCGPHMELWDPQGKVLKTHREAIDQAVSAIREGKIVAVKGIGGFHLFVNAHDEKSVCRLRERKHRELKPLAVMFPSFEWIEMYATISQKEKELLTSSAAPVVLLLKKSKSDCDISLADAVAPDNPCWGLMLPYSPLHHILMRELNIPVVATSGNLMDEPICTDENEALERLKGIADLFLVHDRPIVRSIDDSVVRIMKDRLSFLRRSRGYAPLPVSIWGEGESVLALGGHLKNTIALSVKNNVFISQHIGDLQTSQSFEAFERTTESLKELYDPAIRCVVSDLHPDYFSTKFAKEMFIPVTEVQHHHAHIVSCMAENHLEGQVLGIAWDGTGWGEDQTIWGGEFLATTLTKFKRIGYFKPFRLPGGEKAIEEPRRTAAGILLEIFGDNITDFDDLPPIKAFDYQELRVIGQMIAKDLNSPKTSSVGRLFDAVASLLDVCQFNKYEGQAAMSLEYILQDILIDDRYPYEISGQIDSCFIVDWHPVIRAIVDDIRLSVSKKEISAKFHNTLVEIAVDLAKQARQKRIVLSGGCFQNKYLTERFIDRFEEEGCNIYWHQNVPANDGGISLGQAVSVINQLKERKRSCFAQRFAR